MATARVLELPDVEEPLVVAGIVVEDFDAMLDEPAHAASTTPPTTTPVASPARPGAWLNRAGQ